MKTKLSIIVVLLTASLVRSQVIVAPTILFMGDQDRFGTFIVMNRSSVPQEITISFRFGFPESDPMGNIFMQYDDSTMATLHSCQGWLKGFPQKFIINPQQQQVVRLLATPPPGLTDGEYWTRLVTSSTPQSTVIDTVRTGITANITFVLQQVTTVVYKKGLATMKVSLPDIRVAPDSSVMNIFATIQRQGNSPFFGKVSVVVHDRVGNKVYNQDELIAVYRDSMLIRFPVPLSDLPEGAYTADMTLSSERSDISEDNLLKVPTVEKRATFSVP